MSEAIREAMGWTKRPTDERGLLPLAVARALLAKATKYPGAAVHEGRTPAEVKAVAISHDLYAALVSVETADELIANLLRLEIAYPPLYDARPFVERFGDAILPWLAGQVKDGTLDSKAWEVEEALAAMGTEDAFELLLKVSVIGFGGNGPTQLASVASVPELAPKVEVDVRVLEAIELFTKKNAAVAKRVLARRNGAAKKPVEKKPKKLAIPVVPASKGPSMASLWVRLEKWAKKNARDVPFPLNKPATARAIAAAEKKLGFAFPADFRESLLVHDGQPPSEGEPMFPWMPGCDHLASLSAIASHWQEDHKDADDDGEDHLIEKDRMRNVLRHPLRIPIAGSRFWDQDNTYIDLIPGPKGTVGQVVTLTSECDFAVLGTSLRNAMARWVDLLERGAWTHKGPKGRKASGHTADAFASAKSSAITVRRGLRRNS